MPLKPKRSPDATVGPAVSQAVKQQKSKRMMMFGLRNLSDLCSKGSLKFKENSLFAMQEGIVPVISYCSESYSDDEEVILACLKILYGISEGIADDPDPELVESLNTQGGLKALNRIIARLPNYSENEIILHSILCSDSLSKSKITVDNTALAVSLVQYLKTKVQRSLIAVCLLWLDKFTQTPENVNIIGDKGAADVLVNLLSSATVAKDRASITLIETGMILMQKLAKASKTTTSHMDGIIKILDTYKTSKTIIDRGSTVLASMLGPDELKRCLSGLESAPAGSKERQDSLILLSSMSYIGPYADAIVAADGIPLLCEAIKSSIAELEKGSKDPKLVQGLNGCCKMITKIAGKSQNLEKIVAANGVEALVRVFKSSEDFVSARIAATEALAEMAKREDIALKIHQLEGYKSILAALEKHTKTPELMTAGVAVVAAALSHASVTPLIQQLSPVATLSKCLLAATDEGSCKANCISALVQLAPAMPSYDEYSKAGAHKEVVRLMLASDPEKSVLVTAAIQLTARLMDVAGSLSALQQGETVESVLSAMLEYQDVQAIQLTGKQILQRLATEDDVKRCVQNLDRSIAGASRDSKTAMKSLAAVNGLSQVSRLKSIMVEKGATASVQKGLSTWIDGNHFADQQRLIRAATYSIESLSLGCQRPIDRTIVSLLNSAAAPKTRTIIEKQGSKDNNLFDMITSANVLCKEHNFEPNSIPKLVEAVMKVSSKYQDIRKVQVECIEILAELLSGNSEEGIKELVDGGGLKGLINYMNRVSMYEDVQTAGLSLLGNIIKQAPSSVEVIRAAGGVELCKIIRSTHRNSTQIRTLLVPVASALMPVDFLESEIKKNMELASEAVATGKQQALLEALGALVDLTTSSEAARFTANNRVGILLQQINAYCMKNQPADAMEVAAVTSKLARHICDSPTVVGHLRKNGGAQVLAGLLELLTNDALAQTATKQEGIENNLYATRMLVKADESTDSEVNKKLISNFCKIKYQYQDDANIASASAMALGAMKGKDLKDSADYQNLVENLVEDLMSGHPERVRIAARSVAEITRAKDPLVLGMFLNAGAVAALFKGLDEQGHNKEVRKDLLDSLQALSNKEHLGDYVRKTQGDAGFGTSIEVLTRTLKLCQEDYDSAVSTLKLINRMTRNTDGKLLQDLSIIPLSGELLQMHPESKELLNVLGELLAKAGAGEAIQALIDQIISTTASKPAGWKRTTEALCNKLAVFVTAGVENEGKYFARMPELSASLANVLKSERSDVPLVTSVALVSRRLCDRFEDDAVSSYGLKAMVPELLPAMAATIAKDETLQKNRQFLIDSYRVMAVFASNPNTNKKTVEESNATGLIPVSYTLLKANTGDPDVAARILEFLAAISNSPAGIEALLKSYPKIGDKPASEQLANDVLVLMRRNKRHGVLVAAGVELLSNLQIHDKKLLTSNYIKEIGVLSEATPEGYTAEMNALSKMIKAGHKNLHQDELSKVDARFHSLYDSKAASKDQKAALAIAYANLMKTLAESGDAEALKKLNVVDTLSDLMKDFSDDSNVLLPIVRALRSIAVVDGDLSVKIARQCAGIIMNDCGAAVNGDPILCAAAVHLLSALGTHEGNGRLLSSTVGFNNFIAMIEAMAGRADIAEAKQIKTEADNLKRLVAEDDPKSLTLQQVYVKWNARKEAGETVELSESAVVLQQFDFVADYTEDYSKENLKDVTAELAVEFHYGCLCFSLLHEFVSNTAACLEKDEHKFLLKAIDAQKNDHISQYAVVTCRDLCNYVEAAACLSQVPKCREIIVNCVKRGKDVKVDTPQAADEIMIPRLELVERATVARSFFDGTEIIDVLVAVWNDCDKGKFTIETLRRVFRAMRKIVSETWVPKILQHRVLNRSIDLVNNPNTNLVLLPDVLYLLGALASVPEVKNMVGELNGIEACLGLLVRCLKNTTDNTSAVQTNACLALANITVSHVANAGKFLAAKGVELNVEVMERSMKESKDYDVANASSVLMCNICFRRDDVKQIFGKKRGPPAITNTIQKYDGEDSKVAFRCLASMLKAIGNLALHTDNVQIFLDHGVEQTFAHFYNNSEFLPDDLLEVSLRTMSNLVLEYTDLYMAKFGVVLLPILQMIQQNRRENVKMFALAFEVLANLCRLPANCKVFGDNGGIEATLKIANKYTDSRVSVTAINLLSVQINNPAAVPVLIKAGTFSYLVSVFEGQTKADEVQSEVSLAALRCTRRLLANRPSADVFVHAGGSTAIATLMTHSYDSAIIQLDGFKILFSLLTLYPPPPPQQQKGRVDEDWDAAVTDEGILGVIHRMERPPSPRSWESIGLSAATISRLIVSTCTTLSLEGHGKQIKLQRCGLGLLAYLACEKITDTTESFYEGAFNVTLRQALLNFQGDVAIIETVMIIVNNVLFVSDKEDYVTFVKDKPFIEALSMVSNKFTKKDARVKDLVVFCEKTLSDKKESAPKRFESVTQWEYPMHLTQWNLDPYPNGVQDLPAEVKVELREGGKAKLVVNPTVRSPFVWKSSQDLTALQWKSTEETAAPFNSQLPIGRIKNISRGIGAQSLIKHPQSRKIDDKCCIYLCGPPMDDNPNGLELTVQFRSRKERDHVVQLLVEWRDAATYGY